MMVVDSLKKKFSSEQRYSFVGVRAYSDLRRSLQYTQHHRICNSSSMMGSEKAAGGASLRIIYPRLSSVCKQAVQYVEVFEPIIFRANFS